MVILATLSCANILFCFKLQTLQMPFRAVKKHKNNCLLQSLETKCCTRLTQIRPKKLCVKDLYI